MESYGEKRGAEGPPRPFKQLKAASSDGTTEIVNLEETPLHQDVAEMASDGGPPASSGAATTSVFTTTVVGGGGIGDAGLAAAGGAKLEGDVADDIPASQPRPLTPPMTPATGTTEQPDTLLDENALPPQLDELLKEIVDQEKGKQAAGPAPKDVPSAAEKAFEVGAKEGFNMWTPLGWRFTCEMGSHPTYKSLGNSAKAEFRQKWASDKH